MTWWLRGDPAHASYQLTNLLLTLLSISPVSFLATLQGCPCPYCMCVFPPCPYAVCPLPLPVSSPGPYFSSLSLSSAETSSSHFPGWVWCSITVCLWKPEQALLTVFTTLYFWGFICLFALVLSFLNSLYVSWERHHALESSPTPPLPLAIAFLGQWLSHWNQSINAS